MNVLVAKANKDDIREAKDRRGYLWKFTFSGDSLDGDEKVLEAVFGHARRPGDPENEVLSPEVLKMTREYGLAMEEPNITTIKKLLE